MTYRWHVFTAALDPVQGSEQAGTRPVLVISRKEINQQLPVVNVVPLTSLKPARGHIYPNEASIPAGQARLTLESLADQIRTIDKSRLSRDLGELTDPDARARVRDAVRFHLEM